MRFIIAVNVFIAAVYAANLVDPKEFITEYLAPIPTCNDVSAVNCSTKCAFNRYKLTGGSHMDPNDLS